MANGVNRVYLIAQHLIWLKTSGFMLDTRASFVHDEGTPVEIRNATVQVNFNPAWTDTQVFAARLDRVNKKKKKKCHVGERSGSRLRRRNDRLNNAAFVFCGTNYAHRWTKVTRVIANRRPVSFMLESTHWSQTRYSASHLRYVSLGQWMPSNIQQHVREIGSLMQLFI